MKLGLDNEAVGTGVLLEGCDLLGAGDGDGDRDPFRRLRRRDERSDSGVAGLLSDIGLGL